MRVTESLSVLIDFTDLTLVCKDTYRDDEEYEEGEEDEEDEKFEEVEKVEEVEEDGEDEDEIQSS